MLTVTDAALAHLAEMLASQSASEGVAVRFVCDGKGIAVQPDGEREGDTAFHYAGRTVLLLDEEAAELLTDDTLDMDGPGLSLQPVSGG